MCWKYDDVNWVKYCTTMRLTVQDREVFWGRLGGKVIGRIWGVWELSWQDALSLGINGAKENPRRKRLTQIDAEKMSINTVMCMCVCVCIFRPNNRTSKQPAQRHNSSTVLSTNDVAGVSGNGIASSKLTLRDNWLAGESVAKATSDVTSLRPWSAMSSSSSTAVSSSQHKPQVELLIHEWPLSS